MQVSSPEDTLYATPSPIHPRSPTPMAATMDPSGAASTAPASDLPQPTQSLDSSIITIAAPMLSSDPVLSASPSSDSPAGPANAAETSSDGRTSADPDPQIIEALHSKDRLWVLKLGEMMESLIADRR